MTSIREVESASPAVRRYIVAKTTDVPVGGRLLIEVDGREVGIFNVDGKFYALLNRCPHRAGPLCEGEIMRLVVSPKVGEISLTDQVILTCPWHSWEFDIRTGQSYWDPSRTRGRRFPVDVEPADRVARELESDTAQWVPGPYVADVIPTTVEQEYVLITMRRQPARTETDSVP